jgi:hypothetical protein
MFPIAPKGRNIITSAAMQNDLAIFSPLQKDRNRPASAPSPGAGTRLIPAGLAQQDKK